MSSNADKRTVATDAWQPINTAPVEVEVLVTGPSGYIKPMDRFIINATRSRDYRPGRWLDSTRTDLEDRGWMPTHWAPMVELPVGE